MNMMKNGIIMIRSKKDKLQLTMKSLIFLTNLLVITLLSSCYNTSNDVPFKKTKYYKDGIIKSTQEFINDTVAHGSYIEYYKNKNIKCTVNFENNKKNGEGTWYYKNGRIEMKTNYLDDKQVGSTIYYDSMGNISYYLYYDYLGIPMYKVKYLPNDSLVESGNVLPEVFILRDSLDTVSYTHLTLPTIYSV